MQWMENVIKFFSLFFRSNAFKRNYRTKNLKQLRKINESPRWQIVDIRNGIAFEEHHLLNATNIPNTEFAHKFFNLIQKDKHILLVNSDYRSNLNIYKILKKHHLKVYILFANYDDIRNNADFDDLTKVIVQ
jgi:rhodanese-related sulfurtransferase